MLLNYGRGELPDDHPNSVMDIGSIGMMFGMGQTDVIIAAGIRFNWILQSGQIIRQDCESRQDRYRSARDRP